MENTGFCCFGVRNVRLEQDKPEILSSARDHHRCLLLIEGNLDRTLAAARSLLRDLEHELTGASPVIWVGHRPDGDRPTATQAEKLLGSECGLIVYDMFTGLDPDALAAASGSLRGGGLLILLCPPLGQWSAFLDPAAARIATHPYRAEDVGRRFLTRMSRFLASASAILRHPEQGRTDQLAVALRTQHCADALHNPDKAAKPGTDHWALTSDQERVLTAIQELMTTPNPAPLVVRAARGRGKSTALGLAAGALCQQAAQRVLVTAPRYLGARTLLEHARAQSGFTTARYLAFLPPDALVRKRPDADLLLVDEAAGIPIPQLQELLTHYQRIVFATTTSGYEGTGHGFALRFFPLLERSRPDWRHLELHQPLRFAAGDPLEVLIDRLLLLDAEPAPQKDIQASSGQPVRIARVDREQLSQQEDQLRELFGLLRLAHYQTRPSDLHHLLDGPNLYLTAAHCGKNLVATTLTAREGDLDATLGDAIFAGTRRPRGHLLPQTLSAHAGLASAPQLKYARIVRIAVHPAAQRQGLGQRLLAQVVQHAGDDGCDLIGASFGASAELLAFWRASGFIPVQLGSHRNAATGAQAAVVLRALSPRGQDLLIQARAQFTQRLLFWLPGRLSALEPALVRELLMLPSVGALPEQPIREPKLLLSVMPTLTPQLRAELHAFAHQQRTLEASLPVLAQLAPQPLGDALAQGHLSHQQAECFIATVLQQQPPAEIASQTGHTGRASVVRQLRETAARLTAILDTA